MGELVRFIAQALVNHPDQVMVTEKEDEDSVIIELRVAPDDMGRIIGKQGHIAKAIRTVVRSAAGRQKKRVTVDIV
ncbi:KH domain-containing protein [Mahella australiensis]|uniref:RNA-binding protein KhpA n=1 Tax=Mahella australiensis (strain DSM 15567 / CIP 107919 / 50-1 BON) TaxID=697281 RepID=F4A2S6_MAHA5|nr:KH domain-containing protein [Mahella australiensis]AEE96256.1 RNA-binding protein (KH domain) [Mahella australiensis 50-1 BON]